MAGAKKRAKHPILSINLGKDVAIVNCTDGTSFNLSVGECGSMTGIKTTSGKAVVIEEGKKCTFHLSPDTTHQLGQWASEWPG